MNRCNSVGKLINARLNLIFRIVKKIGKWAVKMLILSMQLRYGVFLGFLHRILSNDVGPLEHNNMTSRRFTRFESLCTDDCVCGQFNHPLRSLVDEKPTFLRYRGGQWSKYSINSLVTQWFSDSIMNYKIQVPAKLIFCQILDVENLSQVEVRYCVVVCGFITTRDYRKYRLNWNEILREAISYVSHQQALWEYGEHCSLAWEVLVW